MSVITHARGADAVSVFADYQNRIYLLSPSVAGHSFQAPAVSLFSGSIGATGQPGTPNDGSLFLFRSVIGQPIASEVYATRIYCQEESSYHFWLLRNFEHDDVLNPAMGTDLWGLFADPDGDGRDNLLEYGLVLNPAVSNASPPIRLGTVQIDGTNHVEVSFNRRTDDPDLEFDLAVSDDLHEWRSGGDALRLLSVTNVSSECALVTFYDVDPLDRTTSRFYRLRVTHRGESAPTVRLISPVLGSVFVDGTNIFIEGTTIPLSADARDVNGCVILVEFYGNGALLGRVSGEDPTLSLTNLPYGSYLVTAMAVDDHGVAGSSSAERVVVDHDTDEDLIPDSVDLRPAIPNVPPIIADVVFSSIKNFHDEGPIQILLQASDADGDHISYLASVPSRLIQAFQPMNPVSWLPAPNEIGHQSLTVAARDPWNAIAQETRPIHVFRTPPRPQ